MNTLHQSLKGFALASLAGLTLSGCGKTDKPKNHQDKEKPNFLLIFIDDLGYPAISKMGNEHMETDHIDRIAEEGMLFTNAYVNPQSTPSRASLLTGQHTARNKMWHVVGGYHYPYAKLKEPEYRENLPRESFTLAEALKEEGYTTACLGKWHLHTWENDGYYTRLWDSTKQYYGFDYVNKITEPSEYQSYGDKGVNFLTGEAIDFMKRNRDTSFFIYLSHHTIHGPVLAPDSLVKKYEQKNYPTKIEQEIDKVKYQTNASYLAALEHLDNSIGRLMDQLKKLGIDKNTIVMFYSDNGGVDAEFDNFPLRNGKGSPYEGGTKVPFFVRYPGVIEPGSTCEEPMHAIDIYPTLLDYAEGENPSGHVLDGVSLRPLFEGRDTLERNTLFWYMPLYDPQWGATPSASVRKGDYKLIEFFGDYIDMDKGMKYIPEGRVELYNVEKDIRENNDLSDEKPKLKRQLLEELHHWMDTMNVEKPKPNPDYDREKAIEISKSGQIHDES